ncbi:Nuclear actin-protein involved in chromatin remodeling, partial [Linderina pennispora]
SELETGEFVMQLKDAGLANEQELDAAIDDAQSFVTRAHNKEMGITEPEDKQPPTFPLLEIPDEELTDEQKQEKLKQKQQKALYDGRERERLEREKARMEQEELERQDDELRTTHFDQWLEDKIARRNQILSRIDERRARRKELHDRRSHASQQRMRSIADLAANESTATGNKRRRRGDQDDDFGAEDDDWNVYRDISKEDDDEEEEADLEELEKNNKVLEQHALFYLEALDRDARAKIENTTIYRFTEGCLPAILEKPAAPQTIDNAAIVARAAREYQLHLNVERIRVPEVLFRPSLVGLDQAGLLETIDGVLRQTGHGPRLVKNVFVTGGGFSKVPGLLERLRRDIVSIVPVGTQVSVKGAADPVLDAWRGAAKWSMTETSAFKQSCITREDYMEFGGEYLKEHAASNRYFRC